MGNSNSSSKRTLTSCDSPSPEVALAMMAVAREVSLERVQIIALRNAMAGLCDENGMIDREGFDNALDLAKLSNVEIFDLLFTMWDNAGIDRVPFKRFCVGISPLACPFDDLYAILRFALRVSDDVNRGSIELDDLHKLLSGINSTASFFGDAHLSPKDIEKVVEAVFDIGDVVILHEDCIRRLASNAYVKRFASGKKRQHVHFKEELVTEITYQKDPEDMIPTPNATIDYLESRSHLGGGISVHEKKKADLLKMTRQMVSSLLDSTGSWDSIGSPHNVNLHHNNMNSSRFDPPATQQNPSYFVNDPRPAKAAATGPSCRLPDPPTTLQPYRQVCRTQR